MEFGGLPAVAYDSDTGLLLGALVAVAKFSPGAYPYAWRVQALLSASIKLNDDGLRIPLYDDSFSIDIPDLDGGALRVGASIYFSSYRDANWYGPGGDSLATVPGPLPLVERYDRSLPQLRPRLPGQLDQHPLEAVRRERASVDFPARDRTPG